MKRKKQNKISREASPLNSRKQWLFMLLFAAIALLSIWAVSTQSKEFSLADFGEYIQQASTPWLIAAVLSMLGFVLFEAFALLVLCRAQGEKRTLWQGYIYAASDIYFSAITPSATGGQPASAYFMVKDGINGMLSTAILIANLCMYTLALVVVSIICFILRFDIFLQYSALSQTLIICGFLVQLGLLAFFFMVLKKKDLLQKMCTAVLRILCKVRILRNLEVKQAKLDANMEKYRTHCKMITDHPKAMLQCFLFNFLQRCSQIAVTMFVYAATTGKGLLEAVDLFFWQCYVVIGTNCIPIPGAMGISDYMMLEGFTNIMDEPQAVNLALLSRALSFYSCVIICGISTLIQYFRAKKRGEQR